MKKKIFPLLTLITSTTFLLIVLGCSSPSEETKPVEPKRLDAVCCSNDSTAIGVTNALLEAGFTAANFPIITGQDCDIDAVNNIIDGTQSMSVLKSTGNLVDKTVEMAEKAYKNEVVPVNNTYYNYSKNVPSYLVDSVVVTKDNYETYLIDTGYYSKTENGYITYSTSSEVTQTISTQITSDTQIGIVLPPSSFKRWREDGQNLERSLTNKGYKVSLQFARGNEYDSQITSQIDAIQSLCSDSNCKVIIIAPVDGYSLTSVLKSAKNKNIKIISYDRLILESDAVSYYVTFDNRQVGKLQGEYLVEKLNLKTRDSSEPVNMEFFTGDERDYNVNAYFDGAMDILKQYIDSGVIVCPSGQLTKKAAATYEWSTEKANSRMKKLIKSCNYSPDL